MKERPRGVVLFCFSPPVMLATIVVEVTLAVYAYVRYKMSVVSRIVVTTLLLLALFQLAEFQTCGRTMGTFGLVWSRIGFVAITLMPPLGIHLIGAISGQRLRVLSWAADISAGVLAGVFAFLPAFMNTPVCGGNYVVFTLRPPISWLYSYYYLGLLAAGVLVAYRLSLRAKGPKKSALRWIMAGYLTFLIPTGVANTLRPSTFYGIPSIMCGFAVIYAVILVVRVLPLVGGRLSRTRPSPQRI